MTSRVSFTAPSLLGAFFLSVSFTACKGKDADADWQGHPGGAAPEQPAAAKETPASAKSETAPAAKPTDAPPAKDEEAAASTETITSTDTPEGVRFVAYNVENWLTMDRTENGVSKPGKPKPEKERSAVIAMIMAARPDVLGVCELGGEADIVEIQKLLADAGHPMPNHIVVGGSDPTRHLGLISKYPIATPTTHENLTYTSGGKAFGMQRGILDAVVDTPAGQLRFIGVHLKSKREVEGEDQEDMRRNEAQLLRRELDGILDKEPQARLVVYGDMNDTRQSPAIRTVQGPDKGPKSLTMTGLKDSRGEYWTQHWSYQDVYSRIDYVMLSNALKSNLIWDECRVMDEPMWSKGSDHRPLLVVFKKSN